MFFLGSYSGIPYSGLEQFAAGGAVVIAGPFYIDAQQLYVAFSEATQPWFAGPDVQPQFAVEEVG
jgi:hypothetical protein